MCHPSPGTTKKCSFHLLPVGQSEPGSGPHTLILGQGASFDATSLMSVGRHGQGSQKEEQLGLCCSPWSLLAPTAVRLLAAEECLEQGWVAGTRGTVHRHLWISCCGPSTERDSAVPVLSKTGTW